MKRSGQDALAQHGVPSCLAPNGYVSSMDSGLEIADSVRECLPPPRLVEAAQAAERGDETCRSAFSASLAIRRLR